MSAHRYDRIGVQLECFGSGGHHEGLVYLDWNATSPIFPEVSIEMQPFVSTHWGNPSSSHAFGKPCRTAVELGRTRVAALLECDADEILFVSCGSEADNHALRSAVALGRTALGGDATPHVVTSCIEHPAILVCLDAMEEAGEISQTRVSANMEGLVDPAEVVAALREETVLVTVMHSQNEVGSVMPIREIVVAVAEAHRAGRTAIRPSVHTDAAQSCGKVPVKVRELGVDLATVVGHKFGAPKGVAALYHRRRARSGEDGAAPPLTPLIYGGGQEDHQRAGTESALMISALGKACEIVSRELDATAAHMRMLRRRLLDGLTAGLGAESVVVNGPRDAKRRLPNTLSVALLGTSSPSVLRAVSHVLACSASAACHTGGPTASKVLVACGIPAHICLATLRLSVGRHTTVEDVDKAVEILVAEALRQRASTAAPSPSTT